MIDQVLNFLRVVIPTQTERVLLAIGATIGGWIGVAVGGYDDAIKILFGFIILDFISGSYAALKAGEWDSRKGYQGIFKKIFICVMVAICHGLDVGLKVDFMREACIMAYIINEAGSLLENIDRMGYGKMIPPFIREGLQRIREQRKELMKGRDLNE